MIGRVSIGNDYWGFDSSKFIEGLPSLLEVPDQCSTELMVPEFRPETLQVQKFEYSRRLRQFIVSPVHFDNTSDELNTIDPDWGDELPVPLGAIQSEFQFSDAVSCLLGRCAPIALTRSRNYFEKQIAEYPEPTHLAVLLIERIDETVDELHEVLGIAIHEYAFMEYSLALPAPLAVQMPSIIRHRYSNWLNSIQFHFDSISSLPVELIDGETFMETLLIPLLPNIVNKVAAISVDIPQQHRPLPFRTLQSIEKIMRDLPRISTSRSFKFVPEPSFKFPDVEKYSFQLPSPLRVSLNLCHSLSGAAFCLFNQPLELSFGFLNPVSSDVSSCSSGEECSPFTVVSTPSHIFQNKRKLASSPGSTFKKQKFSLSQSTYTSKDSIDNDFPALCETLPETLDTNFDHLDSAWNSVLEQYSLLLDEEKHTLNHTKSRSDSFMELLGEKVCTKTSIDPIKVTVKLSETFYDCENLLESISAPFLKQFQELGYSEHILSLSALSSFPWLRFIKQKAVLSQQAKIANDPNLRFSIQQEACILLRLQLLSSIREFVLKGGITLAWNFLRTSSNHELSKALTGDTNVEFQFLWFQIDSLRQDVLAGDIPDHPKVVKCTEMLRTQFKDSQISNVIILVQYQTTLEMLRNELENEFHVILLYPSNSSLYRETCGAVFIAVSINALDLSAIQFQMGIYYDDVFDVSIPCEEVYSFDIQGFQPNDTAPIPTGSILLNSNASLGLDKALCNAGIKFVSRQLGMETLVLNKDAFLVVKPWDEIQGPTAVEELIDGLALLSLKYTRCYFILLIDGLSSMFLDLASLPGFVDTQLSLLTSLCTSFPLQVTFLCSLSPINALHCIVELISNSSITNDLPKVESCEEQFLCRIPSLNPFDALRILETSSVKEFILKSEEDLHTSFPDISRSKLSLAHKLLSL